MTREQLSRIISDIDDRQIAEAYRFDPARRKRSPERNGAMKTKRIITLALAAALILALGIAAYAGFFSMSKRVPEKDETFRINWEENPSGYLEWHDAKLAVTFPETPESREIEFRPGWLPFELPSQLGNSVPEQGIGPETWFKRMTAETLTFSEHPDFVPAYGDMSQPLLIETYAMSQFNDGGALLLLYYTPDEIVEEHWDRQNVDVMRFHCTKRLDAIPEQDIPERTLEQNILLLSDPEAGWVVRICGEISMDELIQVAQNLEIRETGRVLRYDDFRDHYTFFDGGVG